MASGGDDQEEKGNTLQRPSFIRFCSISNDADEDEAKRTDDSEKHISPRSTFTNNLRTEAIPGGETQAHSREPHESKAFGGDDQEEKGNSLQRLNNTSINNEEGEKRTDDNENHLATSFTSTNNLRSEAIPGGEIQVHSGEPHESKAFGGDDQEEKGNSLQRLNNTSNNNEEREKRTDDNENHLAISFTSTSNLRTKAIPGGEIPVHSGEVTSPTLINQASESAMGPHGLVALSSSMTDIIFPESYSTDEVIYSRTPLSLAIENQGEGIMAASGHRNVTSLSQFHLGNNPSFPHIPETSDPDIDFASESRTIGSTEGEFASSFSRADLLLQREPSIHTILSEYSMVVRGQ
ncbi:unnamed protein product [Mytilus coruscus]|uniref:Uncharacterized protein n=1 Tax=Mytilus coruscus TaxID=42192 RepID=A0A6J8F1J7_MYTCO|nr:unnamed protein product [Mytilus coruscus]